MGDDSASPSREPPVRGVESRDGAVVLSLAGELDLYNAEEIRAALAETRSQLGPIAFRLAAPQLGTRRALQVSGLDRHLPVHDTVDGALAS